jgi:hypothetical protein
MSKDVISILLRGEAYLDPGSGSFILQILLATLLGILFLAKTYWQKIKGFFKKVFLRDKSEPEE